MDIYVFVVIGMIVGYLCGSIPFALIIGKIFYKIDVRKYGSGNLGSTNVTRTLGVGAGISVMLLDMIKCGLPSFLMYLLASNVLASTHPEQLAYASIVYCVTGLLSAIGHCHPLFANFKGGKAVASCAGFIIFMNYRLAILGLSIFILIVIITRLVSLGSIIAAFSVAVLQFIPFFSKCYVFQNNELDPSIVGTKLPLFIFNLTIIFMAILLIYRHLSNIQRLLKGTEKKFKIEKVFTKNKKNDEKNVNTKENQNEVLTSETANIEEKK